MTEMHDVVEMLLNRIKDYPEDFVVGPNTMLGARMGKWYQALHNAQEVTTEEERAVLEAALKQAKRAVYMGAALKTMMSDEVEQEEDAGNPFMAIKTQGRYPHQTLGQSIAIPTEGVTSMMTQLEAKQKAMEAQMQRQYAANAYGNLLSTGSALG